MTIMLELVTHSLPVDKVTGKPVDPEVRIRACMHGCVDGLMD
jgi:hypothetical protein